MDVTAEVKKEFEVTLKFEGEHEASVFQSIMSTIYTGKKFVEYETEQLEMAHRIENILIKMWQ